MTYQSDCTLPNEFSEQLTKQGLEGIPDLIRILVKEAMRIERQEYLGVSPYERTPEWRGRANGYTAKTVKDRLGEITFDVPQVREGGFYPGALEKGLRSERALTLTLAEMYVQGVSTRRFAAITERLCGASVSSTQVSRAAALLDEVLEAWRRRPLGEVIYLYLDARYEKVRVDGHIRDAAILLASGVGKAGKRQILGLSVSLSEAEVHWRVFLKDLGARGMRGVWLIISDDHAGLEVARRSVLGSIPWQRCRFQLQQNAAQYVPRKSMRKEVVEDISTIFNAPDQATAEAYLARTVAKYADTASKLSAWIGENLPESLTVFSFPIESRNRLRTTNGLERVSQEIKRRTRVVRIFPNETECLRLVSAILKEISEEWETGKVYLAFENE